MHELAAPMLQVVWDDLDKLSMREGGAIGEKYKDSISSKDKPVLISSQVESDAYLLFCALMKHAKPWYAFSNDHKTETDQYHQPPIVLKSHYIQYTLLKNADPNLAEKITGCLKLARAEPQIWALRWIRLLFAREVGVKNFLWLWDAIFAATDPNTSYKAMNDYNQDYENDLSLEDASISGPKLIRSVETPQEVLNILSHKRCAPLDLLVDYICIVLLLRIRPLFFTASTSRSSSSSSSSRQDMEDSSPSPYDQAAHTIGTLLNYPTTTVTTDVRSMPLIVANAIKLIEHDASADCAGYVARKYSRVPGSFYVHPNNSQSSDSGLSLYQQTLSSQLNTSTLAAGFNSWMDKARLSMTRSVRQSKNGTSPWDEAMQNAKSAFVSVREQVREQAGQMSEQVKEQIRERERERERAELVGLAKLTPFSSRKSGDIHENEAGYITTILENALRVLEEPEYVNIHKNEDLKGTNKETTSEINYKTAVAYIRFAKDSLAHPKKLDYEKLKGYLSPIGAEVSGEEATDKLDNVSVSEKEESGDLLASASDVKDSLPAPILVRSRKGRRIANTVSIEEPEVNKVEPKPKSVEDNKTSRTTIAKSEFAWMLGSPEESAVSSKGDQAKSKESEPVK